jgi:hypothetical protein
LVREGQLPLAVRMANGPPGNEPKAAATAERIKTNRGRATLRNSRQKQKIGGIEGTGPRRTVSDAEITLGRGVGPERGKDRERENYITAPSSRENIWGTPHCPPATQTEAVPCRDRRAPTASRVQQGIRNSGARILSIRCSPGEESQFALLAGLGSGSMEKPVKY